MAKKSPRAPIQHVAWAGLNSENVHLIPAEPVAGLLANGAPVEETTHEYVMPNRKSDAENR